MRPIGAVCSALLFAQPAFAQGFPVDPPPQPPPAAAPAPPVITTTPAPPPRATAPTPTPTPAAPPPPAPTALPPEPEPTAPSSVRLWPVLPYRSGLPIPRGYHLEHRPATGLLLTGGLALGAGYLIGIGVAANESFDEGLGWMFVPLIGPWPAIKKQRVVCSAMTAEEAQQCFDTATQKGTTIAVLAVDGMIQATGVLLLVAGLLSGHDELVRNTSAIKVTAARRRDGGIDIGVTGKF